LGELYMAIQQPAKADPYLRQHLALAKQNDDLQELTEATWNLSENEAALKHFAKAFEYKTQYSAFRDSSFRASSARSNAEMESKYQAEKKEKEIALLKRDQAVNAAQLITEKTTRWGIVVVSSLLLVIGLLFAVRFRGEQKAKRLVEIEKLRNNIARDLHDDIGSALSSININSSVALHRADEQALVKSQLEKIKFNSAKIMESMGDIVWAINPGNDDMEKLIIRMKEFLAEMLEPLNITYHFREQGSAASLPLAIGKKKDIYLIYKEAVNNAAKYSHCSEVKVNIALTSKLLELSVTDNGQGFDPTSTKMGNGLLNMKERALAMGGTVDIESMGNTGTTVVLRVPVAG
uniref:sensor histidine kinase n=1 Tax=Mucilaginibacter sp. TaxID=1882438 RepID=UPI0035BC29E8